MSKSSSARTHLTATLIITPTPDSTAAATPQREFEQLMSDLASGSEEAAWRIAEVYTPHILRVVRAALPTALRRKVDSLDFAQIVWASMLLRRSYLTRAKSPQQLVALLASVARNKVADAFRYNTYQVRDLRRETPLTHVAKKKKSRGNMEGVAVDRNPSPSQLVCVQEKWTALINDLSSRDREILRLRIQGATYPTIAATVNTSEATARRVVDRIIEQMRT